MGISHRRCTFKRVHNRILISQEIVVLLFILLLFLCQKLTDTITLVTRTKTETQNWTLQSKVMFCLCLVPKKNKRNKNSLLCSQFCVSRKGVSGPCQKPEICNSCFIQEISTSSPTSFFLFSFSVHYLRQVVSLSNGPVINTVESSSSTLLNPRNLDREIVTVTNDSSPLDISLWSTCTTARNSAIGLFTFRAWKLLV